MITRHPDDQMTTVKQMFDRHELITRNTGKRWTTEEENLLIKRYHKLVSDSPRFQGQIDQMLDLTAYVLGRSKMAVASRIQKLKKEGRLR